MSCLTLPRRRTMSPALPAPVSQFLGAHAERLHSAELRLRGTASATLPDDDDWPNDLMVVCLTKLVVAAQTQAQALDWVACLPNLAAVCCLHSACPPEVAQQLRARLLAPTSACIQEAVPALRRACRHAVEPSLGLGPVHTAPTQAPRGSVDTRALVDLLRHMASSATHHRLARCCAAWVAAHVGSAGPATLGAAADAADSALVGAASAEAVQLLCQLAHAGCVSPEGLHKCCLLAAVEARTAVGSGGGDSLPPLLDTYLQAVASSGAKTLTPELVRLAAAPLLRANSSQAKAMETALEPCMAPAGSSSVEDTTLLPGHMYLPLGAAANAVSSLLAPSAAVHASHPPSDAAWDAAAARLAAYARLHGAETPQAGLLCVGLVAALASAASTQAADGDGSCPTPEGRSRCQDLLARILAEQQGAMGGGGSVTTSMEEGDDDMRAGAWWSAFAGALCDAALRAAPGDMGPSPGNTAAVLPPDRSDHSGCALASATWLATTWPPCATAFSQLVASHAAAYARSGSGSHLTQCNALLALLRVASKPGHGQGGGEALHPAAALFLADACSALEPAVRAGVSWCAPGMPPPLGVSVTAFCGMVREAGRRHTWWAFLPLCCIPYRKSPEEVIQGWETSVAGSALHADATTAAAAAAAACSRSGVPASWEYLALHVVTTAPDAESGTPAQVSSSPGQALLGGRSDGATTSMLLTWLLLRLHSRVVSDAAVLTPPLPGVAARMRALAEHAQRAAASAAPQGPAQRALSAAGVALAGALDNVDADAAQVRRAAEAAEQNGPSRKRRRCDYRGFGVEAPPGGEDGDTYALQMGHIGTAVQEAVLSQMFDNTGDSDLSADLVRTLTNATAPQPQRARALHVAARMLCCAAPAPHGQEEADMPTLLLSTASLRRFLLAAASAKAPGAYTPEARAAFALCRRTRVLR